MNKKIRNFTEVVTDYKTCLEKLLKSIEGHNANVADLNVRIDVLLKQIEELEEEIECVEEEIEDENVSIEFLDKTLEKDVTSIMGLITNAIVFKEDDVTTTHYELAFALKNLETQGVISGVAQKLDKIHFVFNDVNFSAFVCELEENMPNIVVEVVR